MPGHLRLEGHRLFEQQARPCPAQEVAVEPMSCSVL